MTSEVLSTEDYIKILQNRFNNNSVKFKNASYSPLSENIEGFTGDHYILQLTYTVNNEEKTESFFLKTKLMTTSQSMKDIFNNMALYQKEIFSYNLFKEYQKYGYDTSFAPKCHFCKPNETIVMENLKNRNFILFPRNKYFDLDHCKISLKALAQYHGNALSYEEAKTTELGKTFRIKDQNPEVFKEIFYKLDEPDDFGTKCLKITYESYVKIAEIMFEAKEWKQSFEKRILSLDIPKIFNKDLPYRKTVCHGDLWSNNMLFKYSKGVPIHCCLVDYQVLRYHHPSFDFLIMIYSNTTRQFRQQHYKFLLDYYYQTLEQILKKHGFEADVILPKEHFLKSAEELEIVALMQGASTKMLTLLPPEIMSEAARSGGDDFEKLMLTDKRFEVILEACNNNEEYRKHMFDDVYSINEII